MVRVLPSTAAYNTWVILPAGCDGFAPNCSATRGGLFDPPNSSSWTAFGDYTLNVEQNLGRNESGLGGVDTLALGMTNATGGPPLSNQVVIGIETNDYYTGVFGLNQQPTNFTNVTDPRASFLTSLKTQNHIPSLSWAYTAGAKYSRKPSLS